MKTNAIIRIALCTLGILILSSILLGGILGRVFSIDFNFGESIQSNQHLSSEAYTADPTQIKSIEIDWAAGDITIEPIDGLDHIRVMESECDDKYRMVCKESGSTLNIEFCKTTNNFIGFGTSIDAKDLVIQVPAGWFCQSLELDVAAADVDITNMYIGTLDFDGASGKCNLEYCTVTNLDVDAASGDLTFYGLLDTLEFDGASADCSLILTQCPSYISLDGMSGNLEITLPSDCGFAVTTEGLNNTFNTSFQTISRNGSYYHGDGSCRIDVNAVSGSVTIHDSGTTCAAHHNEGGHH